MRIDFPVNFDDWRGLASEVTWSWYQATKIERDDLREKARAVVEQMDKVHNDYRYHAVWSMAHVHGCKYEGPTYEKELDALRAEIGEGREEAGHADDA